MLGPTQFEEALQALDEEPSQPDVLPLKNVTIPNNAMMEKLIQGARGGTVSKAEAIRGYNQRAGEALRVLKKIKTREKIRNRLDGDATIEVIEEHDAKLLRVLQGDTNTCLDEITYLVHVQLQRKMDSRI